MRSLDMTADILDLETARFLRNPHKEGRARCLACKHEWTALSPIGTVTLECPSCGLMKGLYLGLMETQNAQWKCFCGEWCFFIDVRGPYCAHCGERPEHLTDIATL